MYTNKLLNAKKILIETESRSIFFIRRPMVEQRIVFCSGCNCDVEMLTLDGAVRLSGRRGRELTRLIETGELHSHETPSGYLLICVQSLEELVVAEVRLVKRGLDDVEP